MKKFYFCLASATTTDSGEEFPPPYPEIPRISAKQCLKLFGKQWEEASRIIMRALGFLDEKGQPTSKIHAATEHGLFRKDSIEWGSERVKMVEACSRCHSVHFTESELKKGDRMIREADILMAKAIKPVLTGLRSP